MREKREIKHQHWQINEVNLFFIIANRDGVFTLGQVPPNAHYNHYLHNEYVAFLLSGA